MTILTTDGGPAAAVTRTETNVNDELGRGGLALATLLQRTGEAVADSQRELEKTAADSITMLSKTQVAIVAAEVLDYGETGVLVDSGAGSTVVQSLPLITIMDPPVYQWERVRVQGLFFAREFTSAGSTTTSTSAASGGVSVGGGGMPFFGSAKARFQAGATSTTLETETATDSSVGLMRLNALLTPRTDTGIPKPRQRVIAPVLQVVLGPVSELAGPPVTRSADVTLTYRRADGTPIQDAVLSIEAGGLEWSFVTSGAAGSKTDAEGKLQIRLKRTITDDPARVEEVLSVRIGLIVNDTTVTM